ncbi:MAG: hypothetical protein AAF467_06865 [Actinomycetota bacterium]
MTRDLTEEVDAAMRAADPMPEQQVPRFDRATIDAVTREISATPIGRRRPWQAWRLPAFDRPALGGPEWGRAAFVGALALVAVAVIGVASIVGLGSGDPSADSASVDLDPPATPSSTAGAATEAVGNEAASVPTTALPGASDMTTTTPPPAELEPTTTQPPTSLGAGPPSLGPGQCLAIEAEGIADNDGNAGWVAVADPAASGGAFLVWAGEAPVGDEIDPLAVVTLPVAVDGAGSYRFSWSTRVPADTPEEPQPGSWLAVDGAARFGPLTTGDYGGFVPIVGAGFGGFGWAATASVDGVMSDPVIDVGGPGLLLVQLAPRTEGHEIDRIVFHDASMDLAIAIGSCP